MKKSLKLITAIFLAALILGVGSSLCFAVVSDNSAANEIKSEAEFAFAVSNAKSGDSFILKKDIVLDHKVEIKEPITVDLNNHTVTVKNDKKIIVCGKSEYDHTDYYTIDHPGRYVTELHDVWHDGGFYFDRYGSRRYQPSHTTTVTSRVWKEGWKENCSRDIYKYFDDLEITFKNGTILRTPGSSGNDGVSDTKDSSGQCGTAGKAPIKVFSGSLILQNIRVQGSHGGDGGNGSYNRLWHVPFFTGDGGNGGNGANGGYAIWIDRDEAKVSIDKKSDVIGGKGGIRGKGGKPNPNYWLYSGKMGKIGLSGYDSAPSNKSDRLFYL